MDQSNNPNNYTVNVGSAESHDTVLDSPFESKRSTELDQPYQEVGFSEKPTLSRSRAASDFIVSNVLGATPPVHFSLVPVDSSQPSSTHSIFSDPDEKSLSSLSEFSAATEPLIRRSKNRPQSESCSGCRIVGIALSVLLGLLFVFFVLFPLLLYTETNCAALVNRPENFTFSASHSFIQSSLSSDDRNKLRINQVRMLGTHNSYHIAPPAPLSWISHEWRYTHKPLFEQLEHHGVRSIELDLHQVGQSIYVYHLQLLDYRTQCYCLEQCLVEIKGWMDMRKKLVRAKNESSYGHDPITVFFEAKSKFVEDRRAGLRGGFLDFERLENVIASVFPKEDMYMPSSVQGNFSSIAAAIIQTNGTAWPTLADARNKVMFVMYDYFPRRSETVSGFMQTNKVKAGKRGILFSAVPDGHFSNDHIHPRTSFVIVDDPIQSKQAAEDALDKGFIVRTRSDDKAYLNRERTQAAIDLGAQIIATDYEDIVKNWVY